MDGNSLRQLSVEFFTTMAFCGISSKLISQFVIYNFRNPKILVSFFSMLNFLPAVKQILLFVGMEKSFDSGLEHKFGRKIVVFFKQCARTLKRWEVLFATFVLLVLFSMIFLGEGWWGFLICSSFVALFLWHVVGRVELRRAFANFDNTSSIDSERVIKAAIVFSVLFVCCEAFLAGYFKFRSQLLDTVMVRLEQCIEEGAIVAVTANGILLADIREGWIYNRFFEVPKVIFVPFEGIGNVFSPIALSDGSCRAIGSFPG
ncbi:hypothetical protein [Epibacterium ulvae]|uniref:hypothetical protein n=1 Tax=Epibacterium ulvae TaxID=1156985 RepID=UPI00249323A1|nr:hypothetical protein [Epibacterium ulvae]